MTVLIEIKIIQVQRPLCWCSQAIAIHFSSVHYGMGAKACSEKTTKFFVLVYRFQLPMFIETFFPLFKGGLIPECILISVTGKSLSEAPIFASTNHNMTTDCSLNYEFSTWKFQAQNMLCTQIVLSVKTKKNNDQKMVRKQTSWA